MNSLTVFTVALVISTASVQGIPQGWGWNSPPPPPPVGGVVINEEGASEAIGSGAAISEHASAINVVGDGWVPGLLSLSAGSSVSLDQGAYNNQQSQINSDGSSYAYQGNSAYNNGYASDFLGGDAQGLEVDVLSSGWSAVEGEGAVGQVDALTHQGPTPAPQAGGWRKP